MLANKTTTTTSCRFCGHSVQVKSRFLADFEIDLILNLKLIPHCWKCHREEMTFKVWEKIFVSVIFLTLVFPLHVALGLVWFTFLPVYKFLSLFYD